jgi:hypothetical protein
MDLELVEWHDAWVREGPQKVEDLKILPARTFTIGFLVKEDANGIILAQEYWPEWDPDNVAYPTFIPTDMIVRRTKLGPLEVAVLSGLASSSLPEPPPLPP